MYLRRVRYPDCHHYIIRETLSEGSSCTYRDILDLGCDPSRYIIYPGSYGFYFDPKVEEALEARSVRYSAAELEQMFLPFLRSDIQRILRQFSERGSHRRSAERLSPAELFERQSRLHSFDKRRLHYLKFGRMDIGDLEGRPWPFLKVVMGKCRDEIEHVIEGMERILRPHELRSYLYAALDLQSCFPHHLLRNQPAALDPETVDEAFLSAICRLNDDDRFFMGRRAGGNGTLHSTLTKYVIMYFDSSFPGMDPHAFVQEFVRRHRAYRPPPARPRLEVAEACAVFGITVEEFKGLRRVELIRIYRKKVFEVHPDQGGDHETFVKVTEAYEILLTEK